MKREEVYKLIDGEREYQDKRWLSTPGSRHVHHTPEEWLVYIEDYVNEAKHLMAREPYDDCESRAMGIMRKIAAMAVCAIEQNGAPARTDEQSPEHKCCR